MLNDISFDLDEILSGTADHTHPRYISEAASEKTMEKDIKKFVEKINKTMGTLKKKPEGAKIVNTDAKLIWASNGNFTKIKNGKVNTNISFLIDHFNSLQSDPKLLKANKLGKLKQIFQKVSTIKEKLVEWQPLYTRGFDLKIDLIRTEYECFTLTLVMFVSSLLVQSTYFLHEYQKLDPNTDTSSQLKGTLKEALSTPNNFFLKVFSNIGNFFEKHWQRYSLNKMIDQIYKEVSKPKHKEYLELLIDISEKKQTPEEGVKTESAYFCEANGIVDFFFNIPAILSNLWKLGINSYNLGKNAIMSIIPLLRISNYMKHEKRLSSISVLEEEIDFLEKNIKMLEKSSDLPEQKKQTVIKKQTELMEKHKRTIAKIKAEYDIIDSEATKGIKESDRSLQNDSKPADKSDDDLVLS